MLPLKRGLNVSKGGRNPFRWFDRYKGVYSLDAEKLEEIVEELADINGLTVEEFRSFVNWCYDHPRNLEEVKATEELDSIALWRAQQGLELVG